MNEGYVDVREFHDQFTTIPCKECGEDFYVSLGFAVNYDTWYCDECKPEKLRNLNTGPNVTVRI